MSRNLAENRRLALESIEATIPLLILKAELREQMGDPLGARATRNLAEDFDASIKRYRDAIDRIEKAEEGNVEEGL